MVPLKRPLSLVGTIFDTYMSNGPSFSHARIAFAASSSMGPSYKFSTRYFWATLGDGNFVTIIDSNVSAALIQICMVRFISGLPVKDFSSPFKTMPNVTIIFSYFSFWSSMIARINWLIGVMMNWQKARGNFSVEPSGVCTFVQVFFLALKKESPHNLFIIFSLSTPIFDA